MDESIKDLAKYRLENAKRFINALTELIIQKLKS